MEEIFNRLKSVNGNSVENLIKWLKDCKIIDASTEEKARQLFAGVADIKNVDFAKFKEAVGKLAEEKKKNVEEFVGKLAGEGPKLLSSGLAKFSDAPGAASVTAEDVNAGTANAGTANAGTANAGTANAPIVNQVNAVSEDNHSEIPSAASSEKNSHASSKSGSDG